MIYILISEEVLARRGQGNEWLRISSWKTCEQTRVQTNTNDVVVCDSTVSLGNDRLDAHERNEVD